jgi:PST family polysaccharide transporter
VAIRTPPGRAGPTDVEAAPATLLRRASGALAWSFVNAAVARLGTLAIGILLARLLGPREFGTYAVAYLALTAVLSFNELGVSLAIVRWPGDPAVIAPTVTTVSVASSTVIAAAGWFAAPAFSSGMGSPDAAPVVRLLVLSVIISGLVATPAALMQREFKQGAKMVVDQVNTWLGALISMGLALAGWGAMSLAVGRLAGAVSSGVLFLALSPLKVRFGFDRSVARPLVAFGLPLAGASVVVFAVGYLDQFVVGHLLGATALGFYVLAFNLSSWPVNMFSLPLRSVAPAAFARLQHDPVAMRASLVSVLGLVVAVTAPVCLLLAGAAEPAINLVYGEAWAASARILGWLAGLAVLRIVVELAYDYLVVLGRSGRLLMLQVLWLVALVPALPAGALLAGAQGVAGAQVGVALLVVLPLYLRELRAVGVPVREALTRIGPPLLVATCVGLAAAALAATVPSPFLAAAGAGVVACAAVLLLVYRDRGEIARLRVATPDGPAVDGAT